MQSINKQFKNQNIQIFKKLLERSWSNHNKKNVPKSPFKRKRLPDLKIKIKSSIFSMQNITSKAQDYKKFESLKDGKK